MWFAPFYVYKVALLTIDACYVEMAKSFVCNTITQIRGFLEYSQILHQVHMFLMESRNEYFGNWNELYPDDKISPNHNNYT